MRPLVSRNAWLGIAIMAIALALRLAAGWWWQERLPDGQRFGFPDSESYWRLGQALARGEPYVFHSQDNVDYFVFRTPGYPWLLAQLMRVAGVDCDVRLARVQAAVFGMLAVLGVMGLARVWFDGSTALIAGAMAAVYPEAIALSTFILSEAPFTPLLLAHLYCASVAWKSQCPKHAAGWGFFAGVCGGLATLMRPSWLLFAPFAALVLVGVGPERKRAMLLFATMFAGVCLTLAPWWARNYVVAGRFVPTSLQVGASLYDGLSPQADGGSEMRFVSRFVAEQREADAANPPPAGELFEDRLDRRIRDASLAWAAAHPRRVLELAAVKFLRMWRPIPNAAELSSRALAWVLAATYLPALLLAVLGIRQAPSESSRGLLWLILPALYFTCLHLIFVSSIRYRQPAMLPLLALSAAGLLGLWLRLSQPHNSAGAPTASGGSPP
jgi:4-amino-4-deoxy-L-arabinose transferase-like glycosyltransferase